MSGSLSNGTRASSESFYDANHQPITGIVLLIVWIFVVAIGCRQYYKHLNYHPIKGIIVVCHQLAHLMVWYDMIWYGMV
jgi:hypothetical protein